MEPISLLQLNHIIRDTLDAELPPAYWVMAEIGELRHNQRGHCYLELIEKQDDKLVAKSRATIWAYTWRTLNNLFQQVTGSPLAPGMKILAQVTVQYHEMFGLSLNVRNIDPSYTVGESARRKQAIIEQLQEDGVFDMNRQLMLPAIPQRIAVISSSTAAGWGDFLDQLLLNRFRYRFSPTLFKASMQGEQAEESIIQALHAIYEQLDEFDLVVLIRGGGAKADLDCFDRYSLASHIAQFPLPVLTGIGHERDESVCDLVAHTSMKTPTAVAEFLISGLQSFEERIEQLAETVVAVVSDRQQKEDHQLRMLQQRLLHRSSIILSNSRHQLNHFHSRIKQSAHFATEQAVRQLQQTERRLPSLLKSQLKVQQSKLAFLEKELALIDPQAVLARGYSISRFDGKAIKDQLPPKGAQLVITTKAGTLYSTLDKTEPNEQ